jgi:hypothetical protein
VAGVGISDLAMMVSDDVDNVRIWIHRMAWVEMEDCGTETRSRSRRGKYRKLNANIS